MKQFLLAWTAVLGLTASGLPARATPIDFTYTGSLVTFTVPTTDTYQILALGAQGASNVLLDVDGVFLDNIGGLGAEIGGDFGLTAGETLQIAVGGAGSGTGGGGGSFVVGPDNTPLVIAAGGGGAGNCFGCRFPINGQGGLTGPDGGSGGGVGGTDGNGGGDGGFYGGGGGGGFLSAGLDASCGSATPCAFGGGAFPDLVGGFEGGGFGGGGGGSSAFGVGAGGGGGYSGGGGGIHAPAGIQPGSGGGSFDAGTDQILLADFQSGNGEVLITELVPAPEPASIALLGSALIGLAVVWRRHRPSTLGLRRG